VVRANGTRATSTYNGAGWLQTLADAGVSLQYGFDRAGLRVSTEAIGGTSPTTWSGACPERSRRDGASQLTRARSTAGGYDISYSYDPAGNRTQSAKG